MKRIALLILAAGLCMTTLSANAQYRKGDLTGNAGLSFGLIGYGFGYGSSTLGFPPLTVNVEYSIDDRFAVGPYLGYFSRTYRSGSYRDGFSVFSFGGRGSFHATSSLNEWFNWNIDESKWDIYAAAVLGFEVYSWNYDEDYLVDIDNSGGGIVIGPVIGGRYFFNPNFGVFAETGRGALGAFTLGASMKF
ncbi:hypothetical protein [Cesiribacter sp. SM1]|uniref:hypothetical protein n=1 Tax=Cesiribacter sp. SM1 TaxID=2861196 RepID=UPI001CD681D3|nr:hypothetical protein [Cesiribacter sp. SM1]